MSKIRFVTRRGKKVSFSTGRGHRKTAYQVFVGKKVRAETKKVRASLRPDVARKVMVSAAKEWKKCKKRTSR